MTEFTFDPVDHIRKVYMEAYKNIELIINNCKLESIPDDPEDEEKEPEFPPTAKVNYLQREYNFPLEVNLLLCHPQKSSQMIKYKYFTFYSLNQILSNINHHKLLYDHNRFLDLGHRYHGMGHYVVLSWDKFQKKFFFRLDGGSDGWQRTSREEFFFTKFNPVDEKYQNRMLDWNTALNLITTDEIMNFDHLIFAQ